MRLTPNGRSVSARVARMLSRMAPGGVQVSASMPRPPAFETAAASWGVDALPIGACTTGAVRSSLRQSGVISRPALRAITDHSYHTHARSQALLLQRPPNMTPDNEQALRQITLPVA